MCPDVGVGSAECVTGSRGSFGGRLWPELSAWSTELGKAHILVAGGNERRMWECSGNWSWLPSSRPRRPDLAELFTCTELQ